MVQQSATSGPRTPLHICHAHGAAIATRDRQRQGGKYLRGEHGGISGVGVGRGRGMQVDANAARAHTHGEQHAHSSCCQTTPFARTHIHTYMRTGTQCPLVRSNQHQRKDERDSVHVVELVLPRICCVASSSSQGLGCTIDSIAAVNTFADTRGGRTARSAFLVCATLLCCTGATHAAQHRTNPTGHTRLMNAQGACVRMCVGACVRMCVRAHVCVCGCACVWVRCAQVRSTHLVIPQHPSTVQFMSFCESLQCATTETPARSGNSKSSQAKAWHTPQIAPWPPRLCHDPSKVPYSSPKCVCVCVCVCV